MATERVAAQRRESRVEQDAASLAYAVDIASGERRRFGSGPPAFVLRLADWSWLERLTTGAAYGVATAFVSGGFDVDGSLVAALRWWRDVHVEPHPWVMRAAGRLHLESWVQTRARARRNIQFHYDRSNAFYQQFLDRQMVYSCAYYATPDTPLDQAQEAKLDLICRKLDLAPGARFLDVGCGWGGLVLHAAGRYGARAAGCTLSTQQFEFATEAAKKRGLQARVVVENCDYRELRGRFDRIASVGMYEHVGRHRLQSYFSRLADLLEPDGLVLNHGIARPESVDDDAATAFLRTKVFPGGELPYFADVARAAERAGFEVIDVENLRPHYALTCAEWVRRLEAHRDTCLGLVDAETYRTWRLYLAGSAVSFERGETELYQVLLAKRGSRAPRRLTRAHMTRGD